MEIVPMLTPRIQHKGWAWVEARIDLDSQGLRQFTPCEHALRAASTTELAEIAEIDARAAELDRQSGAMVEAPEWSADEAECINLEEQDIAARRKTIRDGLRVWASEVMAHAGAIVTVSREGDPEILRGLVREADRKATARKARAASLARSGRADHAMAPSDGEVSAPPEPRKAEHSEALERRLSAHRTAALQVEVFRNPTVALAVLAQVFVLRVFGDERTPARTALQVTPSLPGYAMAAAADDLKEGAAWKALEVAKAASRARLPQDESTCLAWLIGLPQAELIELLTLCTALSVSAMATHGGTRYADVIADAVGLDMADW